MLKVNKRRISAFCINDRILKQKLILSSKHGKDPVKDSSDQRVHVVLRDIANII